MLTVPTYATNCLTGAVMFPVLLVVAAIGIGREAEGMALSQVVAQFVPGGVYLACAAGFLALTCTMGLAVSLLWCLMSLLLDVYHPKLKWKTETEAVKQSMNAMVSMFGGMILIAALVGAAALLILWGWPISAALGADVLLLVLLDAALWMVLSRKASVTYCLREYSK